MTDEERELLAEEAASGWRPRTPNGRILEHPAWADLEPTARRQAFEDALVMRVLEAAVDPDGLSTTVRAVLAAIAGEG
jgi:hypothetical protein